MGKYELTSKQYRNSDGVIRQLEKLPYHNWFKEKEYPVTVKFLGPKFLGDVSHGLDYQGWAGRISADGKVLLFSQDGQYVEYAQLPQGVVEISGTVDQLGQPVFAYKLADVTYIYRRDPRENKYETISLGAGLVTPKIILDYPSAENVGISDISCFYVKNDNLCYRLQSENYQNEYLLKENCNPILKVAYTQLGRLQFELDYTKTGIDVERLFGSLTNIGECDNGQNCVRK